MSEKTTREERKKRDKALEQSDYNCKQTEENLKLFKKVVDSATDAIGISTAEGRHWYQNAAFDALFGDVGGDPPATLYCDKNRGAEVFETIMAGGEWSGEVQMYAADGRVLDILLRAYAFADETGRVLGLVGVHTDITTSNRSRELFKRVAQSTNDVFYEWNVQTDALQWFSDISAELGYAPGEVPPTINGWIELIHPDDRPQLADAVMKHRTATHDISYLYRVKHKNGTWRYWRDHATPILDSHNRPIRWVGGISDITEHKQVENAYRESEARFLQIAENIREVFWLFDLQEQRVLYVSPAYEQIWGRSRESLYERYDDWVESIHTEDVKHAQETFNHILDTGGGEPREYRIVRPDGTERWISDTGYVVRDGDGKIVRVTGIVEDITERKKAEEALVTKASLERIISETSRQFLTLTELDKSINACLADIGRFCAAGRAYLFQFTSGGVTMNNTHEWCAPGVKPEIENLQGLPLEMFPWWMKVLEAGENIHVKNVAELPPEARAEKKILEAQNIKSVLVVPFLVDNRLAGFLGFDNVASTRAWGEKELIPLRTLAEIVGAAVTRKRAVDALRQSEAQFRDLANMLPQIVFETDVKGNLTFVNYNALNTFGYTNDDFALGLNATQMIVSKDRDRAADRMRQIMTGSKNLIGSEYSVKKKDGTEIPVIIYSARFLREGSPAGLRGIMIDITDRKRAEEERKNLQAQLIQAQKMEAIGTLAGGIAHNFNNILMGVQGRTSLMIMGKDNSHPDYEHLRGIEEYVKNAVELTRDLLGFARGGKYEVKPTDLNTLIKHENRMFGRTKREIRVHEKYEKDLWTVEVDQSQIKQAILNLYVNAWQAMPGEGDLYIQTENVTFDKEYIKLFEIAPGRYVKVSVTDTGVGMDAATQERIFDPFFSIKEVGQGSGLGLASVYGIIKNHGGFINVYSERGEGTTFNIYLPASKREAEEEDPGPKRHEIQYGQGTVLLVDDEDMIVEVGQAMLKKLGYRAFIARSGQEALNLYKKQREEIDLIILDMIMPGMGGGETYDQLRKIDGDVKVILSSGYSIEGQAKEIMDRGCSGFIQKPFAMEALSRMVREELDEGKTDGHH
ncbi:MAG: PAS domain S-box protein [Desulfobacterales bacterium]|nr:PAS domain S-box protein [Desulfobacterales bacterium]